MHSVERHIAEQAAPGERREFLTFTLGSEEYGVDILKVQEIRGYEPPTPIANTPGFILGVINLRGAIVPVLDLRVKFHLAAEYHERTVVIVLNLSGRIVGVVVDGVSDVVALDGERLKPPPDFTCALDTRYLVGLGTLEDRMLIVVDIERLMNSREMALIERAAEDPETEGEPS
jgi:purine-binding chemotaxis protein CheW